MRQWSGIRRDTAFTDDAPYFVQNARYWVGGELQRRAGMEKYTAQTGQAIANFRTPVGDYFIVYQDYTGNLISVSAT